MAESFRDKTVIVTGGSAGIGKASALEFAKESANVVIAARNVERGEETAESVEKAGGNALFVQTDVSKASDVEKMVNAAIQKFGNIDCAVNNAGIEGPITSLVADVEEEDWNRIIDINLKGVWLCLKYEIRQMLNSGGGSIVNMSSIGGMMGSRNMPVYSASKHGVIGLTKSAAAGYATDAIRVNAVCPGLIRTPMGERVIGNDPEREERLIGLHPMSRLGKPIEVAEAVIWLCSDKSSFVTGCVFPVDGGAMAVK